jgi:hypothetical protein
MLHQLIRLCNKVVMNNTFGGMYKQTVVAYNFFLAGCWLVEACWHRDVRCLVMAVCVLPGVITNSSTEHTFSILYLEYSGSRFL